MSIDFNLDGFSFTPDSDYRSNEQFPRMWWYNGSKQAGTNGFFYTSAREFPNGLTEPWEQVEKYDDEVGYMATTLSIAIVRKRVQAYTETRIGNDVTKTWHKHYKPNHNMKLYTELLCLVKGMDDPVVWIVKGMTGRAVTKKGEGIVDQHHDAVFKQAAATWRAQGEIPSWAFWTTITAPTNAKGKPDYVDTGYGSHVTPPRLSLANPVNRDVLKQLYVGRELLEIGKTLYVETADWQKQLRANDEDTQTQSAPPAQSDNGVDPF